MPPVRPEYSRTSDQSFSIEDVVTLTTELCDIPSVSHHEAELADRVEQTLQQCDHLLVLRDGNTIVARSLDAVVGASAVVIAGHLDTVPIAENLPCTLIIDPATGKETLVGRGTVDMKAGVAMMLRAAVTLKRTRLPVTWVFYEAEEVAAKFNGLRRILEQHRDWIIGDFGVLCEPTSGDVEGGCQGTLRFAVTTQGRAAHTARSWMGANAIHAAQEILSRLNAYQPRTVTVEGLEFREGMNAVRISGGIAGNVVPDSCTIAINYRFAPDRSLDEAIAHCRELFDGFEIDIEDQAPAARPGLDQRSGQEFVAALGMPVRAKLGWTDVARLAEFGIPAVNFGPGDPTLAHMDDERVSTDSIRACSQAFEGWLRAD